MFGQNQSDARARELEHMPMPYDIAQVCRSETEMGQLRDHDQARANLVHASFDKACREPLKLLACLDEQAACWNLDCQAPAIAQPDKQAREA